MMAWKMYSMSMPKITAILVSPFIAQFDCGTRSAKHLKDRATGWQKIYPVSLLIALGMLALYFSMVADLGMPGSQQRVFIFLFLLWLSIVVHNFFRLTA
jgi:hypothetical protein